MVKVSKLWGNARFAKLAPNCKLLYLYLVTQPSISVLGVLEIDSTDILYRLELNEKEYRYAAEWLHDSGYVDHYERLKEWDVFIIKDHFLSLSKSKLNLRKGIEEGRTSPYKAELLKIYSKKDFEANDGFTPPTPEEVTQYALGKGFVVNGHTFVDYYASNDWYNKNNKKVRNWKATVDRVWCRDDNKLESCPGAPEGFEYFHITLEDGTRVSPSGWKDGRPTHKDFLLLPLLTEEYERCTKKKPKST